MSCVVNVSADHGDDGGSINEVVVTSTEQLHLENLPDFSKVEFTDDFVTTQSWAYISWINNDDNEDERAPGIGVHFSDEFGADDEKLWASFYALSNVLRDVVLSGEYVEKIYHSKGGTKTEFEYQLPTKVFKEM